MWIRGEVNIDLEFGVSISTLLINESSLCKPFAKYEYAVVGSMTAILPGGCVAPDHYWQTSLSP